MATTQPMRYPIPPPTSNALNTKQRNRLVRSTRKLGTILGSTPLITDNDEAQTIEVALYPTLTSSSASSSRSTTPDNSAKAARRHASICSYTPESSGFVYLSPSGISSVVTLAPPPAGTKSLTKKASMKFKAATKSRELPELARPVVKRLQAVPHPITVRAVPPSPAPSATSGWLTPCTPTPIDTPIITPTTPVFPSAAETRRKRMAKLTRTLGEIIPPHLVFANRKTALPVESAEPSSIYLAPTVPEQTQPATGTRKRRSMSVDFSGQITSPVTRSSKVWVTGNQTWRGEWNRKDIKDVQKQLRSLKAR